MLSSGGLRRRFPLAFCRVLMNKITALTLMLVLLAVGRGAWSSAEAPMPVPPREAGEAEKLVRVNDHVITRKELETFFEAFYLNEPLREEMRGLPPLQREQLYGQGFAKALPELVEQRLLLAEARREYTNTEAVQKAIDEMLVRRLDELSEEKGSLRAALQSFHHRGITLEEWRELMADAILAQNYLWGKLESPVHIRPAELRLYYRRHRESLRRPRRVLYRLILVDPAGCENEEQERAKAESILEQIRQGADFAQLAERHSLDRDETEGGLREVEASRTSSDWLPPLCRGLKPGEVSGVQKSEAGYCIARLEKVIPSHVPSFEEVQQAMRAALSRRKREEAQRELIDRLRSSAHVQYLPAGEKLLGR